jgi:hypothetical protein
LIFKQLRCQRSRTCSKEQSTSGDSHKSVWKSTNDFWGKINFGFISKKKNIRQWDKRKIPPMGQKKNIRHPDASAYKVDSESSVH